LIAGYVAIGIAARVAWMFMALGVYPSRSANDVGSISLMRSLQGSVFGGGDVDAEARALLPIHHWVCPTHQ
jgi:hypothetical protein